MEDFIRDLMGIGITILVTISGYLAKLCLKSLADMKKNMEDNIKGVSNQVNDIKTDIALLRNDVKHLEKKVYEDQCQS